MTTNNGAIHYASRETFLAPAKRRFRDVYLPVSGQWVRIRSLFEGEKEAYEAGNRDKSGEITNESAKASRRKLIALCVCDSEGNRILSDADIDAMKEMDGTDIAYLQDECLAFCGFKKVSVEELTKNSVTVHDSN